MAGAPRKTHCIRGHKYTDANTILERLASGYTVRKCVQCRAMKERERYADPIRQARKRHLQKHRLDCKRADRDAKRNYNERTRNALHNLQAQ